MLSNAAAPFMIVRTDPIEVRVSVTEAIVNSLALGQRVPVAISAASGQEFDAEITTLAPGASEATAGFEVRLSIHNPDHHIKPGMYAEARFVREYAAQTLVVSRGAVLAEQEKRFVFVARDGEARKVEVETGIDTGEEIEIKTGLAPGDPVVVKGQTYLKNGSKIQVSQEVF
jgi:RND family efflux transporter MFP subunit